mmetsp:Transcript_120506/g.209788  ORF Transcript_120506/g.209788 Transcript_120506/m.209788 type:complete len:110 (-) Transcript_120506:209-538(-)
MNIRAVGKSNNSFIRVVYSSGQDRCKDVPKNCISGCSFFGHVQAVLSTLDAPEMFILFIIHYIDHAFGIQIVCISALRGVQSFGPWQTRRRDFRRMVSCKGLFWCCALY